MMDRWYEAKGFNGVMWTEGAFQAPNADALRTRLIAAGWTQITIVSIGDGS